MALALPFSGATALAADGQPSSKVTAKTANLTLIPWTTGNSAWVDVLTNTIKTANQKDLFIGASFEIGLYTRTLVKSKNMVSDTSSARTMVQVQVLIDGKPAEPGAVVLVRRSQTLIDTLAGGLTVDPITGSIIPTGTPEEIDLILTTMDAASFNFVAVNVPQGVHTIKVQARINTGTSVQEVMPRLRHWLAKDR